MKAFETIYIPSHEIACDGGGGALGHPKVYLHIDSGKDSVVCPYCSRTYIYKQPTARKKQAAH